MNLKDLELPISFFSIFILITCSVKSQNITIKGSLINENKEIIESGNVMILSPIDSSIIKGTFFLDGKFELQGIESLDVILKINSLSYLDYYYPNPLIPNSDGVVDIGVVTLKKMDLKAINVVAQRPVYEKKIDRTIVNVEGTILENKGTAMDVIRSSPSAIVKSDGSIEVVGKGSAIVYLDGQRVNFTELLKSVPSRDIKNVSIITSPGAKYDAEANAVIEIKTKKSEKEGYQIMLFTEDAVRTNPYFSYGGNISYRKNRLSLFFHFGKEHGTLVNEDDYFRKVENTSLFSMENHVKSNISYGLSMLAITKIGFDIDSISGLFVYHRGRFGDGSTLVNNENRIFNNSQPIDIIKSETIGDPRYTNNSLTGGYFRELDTLGSEFRFTTQFTNYRTDDYNKITQRSGSNLSFVQYFQNKNFNDHNIFSGQIDFGKSITEEMKMELGVKK